MKTAKQAVDNLSRMLRSDRRRDGLGVREAAKRIGISPATYSRLENGGVPSLETLVMVCDWYGISLGVLFDAN